MVSDSQTLITVREKSAFTLHFLQSLSKIKQKKPFNLNHDYNKNQTNKRARKIKTAAYETMARVGGGTSRPWTRALLWKLHRRKENNKESPFLKRRKVSKRDCGGRRRWRRRSLRPPAVATEKLRRMVPGGGGMETWRLMEETAHYIKCLSMQVKVMQSLVDSLSP